MEAQRRERLLCASTGEQKQGSKQVMSEWKFDEQEAADRLGATMRGSTVGGGNSRNKGSAQMLLPQSGHPLSFIHK